MKIDSVKCFWTLGICPHPFECIWSCGGLQVYSQALRPTSWSMTERPASCLLSLNLENTWRHATQSWTWSMVSGHRFSNDYVQVWGARLATYDNIIFTWDVLLTAVYIYWIHTTVFYRHIHRVPGSLNVTERLSTLQLHVSFTGPCKHLENENILTSHFQLMTVRTKTHCHGRH